MKIMIKDFSIRGRHFTIVHSREHNMYLAIEDKYINEDGRLNTKLNGLQMHAGKTMDECINYVTDMVEVEYLVSQGHTKAEAMCIYWNMMDNLVMMEHLLNEQEGAYEQ